MSPALWSGRASVYRALENRVPVLKTDYGWDTALVDACGRSEVILNATVRGARRTIMREVPLGDGSATLAASLHDAIGWMGAIGCLHAVLTASWWRAR